MENKRRSQGRVDADQVQSPDSIPWYDGSACVPQLLVIKKEELQL
jgi:hypothetical protein